MKQSKKRPISRVLAGFLAAAAAFWNMPEAIWHGVSAETTPEPHFLTMVEGEPSEYGYRSVQFVDEDGDVVVPDLMPNYGNRALNLPESFDLRDEGVITSVKNQGETGTCWAHAGLAAAESNMVMNGLADTSIDLSETHLVWFTHGQACTNTEDPLYGDGNTLGTDAYYKGGSIYRVYGTLGSWKGVQLQQYTADVTECAEVDESQRYVSYGHLTNNDMLDPLDLEGIKTHLMTTGPMVVAYWSDSHYSKAYHSYYQTEVTDTTNHEVVIVGWDDHFSKENYNDGVPEADGAWICKNSWGTDWGEEGYFYMSYYEPSIPYIASVEIEEANNYDSIYQYDSYIYKSLYYPEDTITGANVFQTTKEENLTAVSFYSHETDLPYTISIYEGVKDGDPISGTLLTTQSGTMTYAGYHTVKLDQVVTIEENTKFSVVVKLDKIGAAIGADNYANAKGCSYYTWDAECEHPVWKDGADSSLSTNGINLSIKAFTTDGVPVNAEQFPDANFRTYILENLDKDGNGILSDEEIVAVTSMDVSGMEIRSLEGIAHFTALGRLNCSDNPLAALDLSANRNITSVNCENCTRSYETFRCSDFKPEELDMSRVSNLTGAVIKDGAFLPTDTTITYQYDIETSAGYKPTFTLTANAIVHYEYGIWTKTSDIEHQRVCTGCADVETGTHSYEKNWTDNGDGTHIRNCEICESLQIATHNFSDWSDNADGTHSRTCGDCGLTETSAHDFGDWTDNADGTHSRTCGDCGLEETSAHDFGDWTDNADGTHSRTCGDCGAIETSTHNFSNWTDNADGTHSRTCGDCGAIETSAHDFGDWSDNADGTHSRTCSDCGLEEASAHNFSDWSDNADGTHSRICGDCGVTETAAHQFGAADAEGIGRCSESCLQCDAVRTYILGDVFADGVVNAFDLAIMKRILLREEPTPTQFLAADVNQDDVFSVADLIAVQKFLLGRTN